MENKIEFLLEDIETKIKINPNQPELWIEKGLILSKMGLLERALNSFDQALLLSPDSETAKIHKGSIYIKLNKEQEASKILDEVISINKKNKNAWLLKGLSLIETSTIEEVETCFDKALEIDNNYINAWFKKLEINKFIRNENQIEFCLNNIRRLLPDKIDYWVELGLFFIETNQYEKATNFYDELLTLKYKPEIILSQKAEIFARQKEYQKAIDLINESLSINPHNDDVLSQKANIYLSCNDIHNAKIMFEQAIQINPRNLKALLGMAEILFKEKKYHLSFDCFNKITEIHPHSYTAWNKLGILFELQNKFDNAIECYSKAISINKNFLIALYNKAQLLFQLHEYSEAILLVDNALSIKVNDIPLLKIKAECLAGLKLYDESLAVYKKIIEQSPDDIDIQERLANNLILIGKNIEAIKILENLVYQGFSTKTVWYNIGIAYHKEKLLLQALEAQIKAISIDSNYTEAIDSKSLIEKEIYISERKRNHTNVPIPELKEIKICPQCGLDMFNKTCSNCFYQGEAILPSTQEEQIERLDKKNILLTKKKRKNNNVNIETYFSLIFQPKSTFNEILNTKPMNSRPVILFLIVSNLSFAISFLNPSLWKIASNFLSLPFAFMLIFFLSIILSCVEYFITATLIKLPGSMIGGKASTNDIRLVLGWSNLPKIFILPLNITYIIIAQTNLNFLNSSQLLCFGFIYFIQLFLWIWHILLFYKFLAQAQKFSWIKAVVSFIIFIIIISFALGIISVLAALLVTLFFKGKVF